MMKTKRQPQEQPMIMGLLTFDKTHAVLGKVVTDMRAYCANRKVEMFFAGRWLVKDWDHLRNFNLYRLVLKKLEPANA